MAVLDGVSWHSFPSLVALSAKGVEETLRKMGFGYRAKFISQSARMVTGDLGGEAWLRGLRDQPYQEAHPELMKLPGVGAKVRCIILQYVGVNKYFLANIYRIPHHTRNPYPDRRAYL